MPSQHQSMRQSSLKLHNNPLLNVEPSAWHFAAAAVSRPSTIKPAWKHRNSLPRANAPEYTGQRNKTKNTATGELQELCEKLCCVIRFARLNSNCCDISTCGMFRSDKLIRCENVGILDDFSGDDYRHRIDIYRVVIFTWLEVLIMN